MAGNMAWLDYRDGRTVVKNPDEEIIGKLCTIAASLGAHVQGDDGESYPLADSAATSAGPTLPELLARPLRALRGLFRRGAPLTETPTKFKKGQRYRYLLGGLCTVISVDPRAEHGAGLVTVQMDDGRRLSFLLVGETESMFLPPD